MSYRETNLKRYLDQAKNIANFIINNPNLPEDKIPYWDFNDPKIPESYRDASAGAIIASALIELSDYAVKGKYTFIHEDINNPHLCIQTSNKICTEFPPIFLILL